MYDGVGHPKSCHQGGLRGWAPNSSCLRLTSTRVSGEFLTGPLEQNLKMPVLIEIDAAGGTTFLPGTPGQHESPINSVASYATIDRE